VSMRLTRVDREFLAPRRTGWLPEYAQRAQSTTPTDSLEGKGGYGRYTLPEEGWATSNRAVDPTHRKWASVGDPHITMGKEKFDQQVKGNLVLLRTQEGDFQVQARQTHPKGNDQVTVNTRVAIKDGDNLVHYDTDTNELLVNGKPWDGQSPLPGGTQIARTGDGFQVTSARGDVTSIHDRGDYLDLDGEIAPDRRTGEIRGAFGSFDNVDDFRSHLLRDGTIAPDNETLAENWIATPEEDLVDKPPVPTGGGPGGVRDGLLRMLTALIEQLTALVRQLSLLFCGRRDEFAW